MNTFYIYYSLSVPNLTILTPQIHQESSWKVLWKIVNIIKFYIFIEIYLRFNPHNNPVIIDKEKILLFHFYKWENWSSIKVQYDQNPDSETNHFNPSANAETMT